MWCSVVSAMRTDGMDAFKFFLVSDAVNVAKRKVHFFLHVQVPQQNFLAYRMKINVS